MAVQQLKRLVDDSCIHDWEHRKGRPRVERRVIVFCLLVKALFNVRYRRLQGLLELLQPPLGLATVPHFNTAAKYGRDPGITTTLERLLQATARTW